jgi:Acyl-CoA dehydrogenase, C-terminal domain
MIEGPELELLERALDTAVTRHSGVALDTALLELGWLDAISEDPRAAVRLLFSLQGAANATSSAIQWVVAHGLGYRGMAAVLPAIGATCPPATLEPGRRLVDGVAMRLGERSTALVVAGEGSHAVALEVPTESLPTRRIEGIDPSLELLGVRGDLVDPESLGAVDWPAAVAVGQLALAHELIGASRRMLQLAREHAIAREQFGRPIATFQAIRNRLAEALVAIEAAHALVETAWDDHGTQTAAMAKAMAGTAARLTARHCQQVLAGVGFTTEHPLHRYLRRILLLEHVLGATRTLTRELGAEILQHKSLPALLPL